MPNIFQSSIPFLKDIIEMIERSQKLALDIMNSMTGRIAPSDNRNALAGAAFDSVLEHQRAVNLIIQNKMHGSALALLRPMYEGCITGLWCKYVATDKRLCEFEEARFNLDPRQVISDLKATHDVEYRRKLLQIHNQSWRSLHSYVHSGILPISRRLSNSHIGNDYKEDDAVEILQYSNLMAIIAAIELPDLTDDLEFRESIYKVVNEYSPAPA